VLSELGLRNQPLVPLDTLRTLSEDDFPCGVILGVCELVRINQDSNSNWASFDCYADEVYNWILETPRLLPDRIPLKGRLGLFDPPEDIAEAIRRIL
jgi:hypothetical protein